LKFPEEEKEQGEEKANRLKGEGRGTVPRPSVIIQVSRLMVYG
jgi:hypothetical protein